MKPLSRVIEKPETQASEVVRKPAIVEAMAEKGDMSKVQAEAALVAFTDVVMSNVSGEGMGTCNAAVT